MIIRLTTKDRTGVVTAVTDSRYENAARGWKAARATFTSFETSSKSSRLMTALRAGKKVAFNSGRYEMEVVEV
jgi:hypothetical protein